MCPVLGSTASAAVGIVRFISRRGLERRLVLVAGDDQDRGRDARHLCGQVVERRPPRLVAEHGVGRALRRVLREVADELGEAARILVPAAAPAPGRGRRSPPTCAMPSSSMVLAMARDCSWNCRVLRRMRAIAAAGHHQRQRARRIRRCRNAASRSRPSTVPTTCARWMPSASSTQRMSSRARCLRVALDVLAARPRADSRARCRRCSGSGARSGAPAAPSCGSRRRTRARRRSACRRPSPRSRASRRRPYSGSA